MTTTVSAIGYSALHAPMIERLTALGRSLTPDQWTAPSLCDKWRVCDVYGHMTYGGVTPLRRVVPLLLFRYHANLNRGSGVESVRYADRHPQSVVMDEFRRSSYHPVGIGKLIKAPELHMDHIVHEIDIRRPLGLPSEWERDDLRGALDAAVVAKSPLIAPAKMARELRLVATDLTWSHGPLGSRTVEGPAEDLLLVLCGRPAGLAALTGSGVAELMGRITH